MDIAHPPVPSEVLIREVLDTAVAASGLSSAERDDLAARMGKVVLIRLQRTVSGQRIANLQYRVDFNSSDQSLIQGACFIEPSDSVAVKNAKTARLGHQAYRNALVAATPRELEGISRGVLVLLGCDAPVVTRYKNDQGIDFYGELKLEGRLGDALGSLPGVERDLTVWVIGQAKQYEGKASTFELRDLAGAIALARAKVSGDNGSALRNLTFRVFDPVVSLFITTGELTKDSRKIASTSGMVVMNGEALAAFLADRRVGQVRGSFSSRSFKYWVRSNLNSL